VTTDASGDYTGMGGPMASSKSVQHNYRLLGAIFEAPDGNFFIKFTGPAKTIAASRRNVRAIAELVRYGK